jgi:hypothetical protein
MSMLSVLMACYSYDNPKWFPPNLNRLRDQGRVAENGKAAYSGFRASTFRDTKSPNGMAASESSMTPEMK